MNNLFSSFLKKYEFRMSLLIFFFGVIFLLSLRLVYLPYAIDHIYFQEWSSEDMMQTVSLLDLENQPFQSLFYLHIQPPLLDTIRLIALQFAPINDGMATLIHVDQIIYNFWLVVYALMGVIIFNWLLQLKVDKIPAFAVSIFFFFHPAAIFYATFLEGTLLTSFGVLLLFFGLWELKRNSSIWMLASAYLLLFSIRSIFQWPALVVLFISLIILKVKLKEIILFVSICGIIIAIFMVKQFLIFGTASTSSFFGSSCFHSLGIFPRMGFSDNKLDDFSLGPAFPYQSFEKIPDVLTRSEKLTGVHNFNNLADLENEKKLLPECINLIFSQPLKETILSYIHNTIVFFQPSSNYYTSHAIVDHLPWRSVFNFIFSGLSLFLLILFSSVWWLLNHTKKDLPGAIGFLLPILYIFLTCIFFEKIENMRYKFFIEPVLFVFIVSQISSFFNKIIRQRVRINKSISN